MQTIAKSKKWLQNIADRLLKKEITKIITITGCFAVVIASCKKNEVIPFLSTIGYEQTNLVADTASLHPAVIDHNLINAWGIATAPSGPIWISSNNAGLSTIYNASGTTLIPPVTIPSPTAPTGGTPTGIVFNNTTDFGFFVNKTHTASKFIFATEDGTLAAWGGGSTATIVVNRSSSAVYKGLALVSNSHGNFLCATNFMQARVDVFDKNYNLVSGPIFMDPKIPAGFAPFNIKVIGEWIYVTYAKQKPDKHDDQAGAGNGFIDIFKTADGSFVKRFASQGALNSPWGLAQNHSSFCNQISNNGILVGNFGDGRINLYDSTGNFVGPLRDGGRPIVIDGLWALDNEVPNTSQDQLFFTAGPYDEQHGLFGYLQKRH